MLPYVFRRLLQAIPILLAVAALIFVLFSVIPGNFATSQMADGRSNIDAATIERMNQQFGLNDPLPLRFAKYVGGLATFDLGDSFRTRQPVTALIGERLWPSLQLALAAMLFAVVIGVPLGFVAALKPGSWVDMLSMVFAVSGLSLPMFWLGLLLMYAFALTLNWFPSFGYGDGDPRYIVLPAIALGVSPLALLARTARAAVLEVMHADFVRTAQGYDTQDLELDIVVFPDGSHVVKDLDLLDQRVDEGRWSDEAADWIRSVGSDLVARLESEGPWWDEQWSEWEPPSGWRDTTLPAGWSSD